MTKLPGLATLCVERGVQNKLQGIDSSKNRLQATGCRLDAAVSGTDTAPEKPRASSAESKMRHTNQAARCSSPVAPCG